MDRKIPTQGYNNRTVYDYLNNLFTCEFCSPSLNPHPITFDYRPRPHKIARYTPDMLPNAIYVASENSFCTLTTPSDYPDLHPSDDPNNIHVKKKYVTFLGRVKRGYCCRKHDKNIPQEYKVLLLHMI